MNQPDSSACNSNNSPYFFFCRDRFMRAFTDGFTEGIRTKMTVAVATGPQSAPSVSNFFARSITKCLNRLNTYGVESALMTWFRESCVGEKSIFGRCSACGGGCCLHEPNG
jgi:hypothetical protein